MTRILRLKSAIKAIYIGIKELGIFIIYNNRQERLEVNSVKVMFPIEH